MSNQGAAAILLHHCKRRPYRGVRHWQSPARLQPGGALS